MRGPIDPRASSAIEEAELEAERLAEELLFECPDPPDDEWEIIFSKMPHDDKLELLRKLRQLKAAIHLRGMGVSWG